MKMRPEDTLHIEQIKKLGHDLKKSVGINTTKVQKKEFHFDKCNVNSWLFSKDGMFGGIATWDRENKSFIIHKSGEIFRLTNKLIIEITFGEQGLHPRVILST